MTKNNSVRVYVRLDEEGLLGSVRATAKALSRRLKKKVRVYNAKSGILYADNGSNRTPTKFRCPLSVPASGKVTISRA